MKFSGRQDEWQPSEMEARVVIQVERRVAARVADSGSSSLMKSPQTTSQVVRSQRQQQQRQGTKKRRTQKWFPVLLLGSLLLPFASCQTTSETGEEGGTSRPASSTTPSAVTVTSQPESNRNESSDVTSESTAAADFGGPPTNGESQDGAQAQTKLKPINFTLVDETFDAALSEDEVVKKWKFMDSQLQDGMKSILKMVFPQIVALSQDAKVSGDCSGGILKWILSLRNLRSWAIKMLDATGKPTAGIFEGSLTMFGNYRQCLSIRAPDEDEIEITEQFEEYFRGQFCVIHLKPWMPIKKPFYHLNSTVESLLRKNYRYYEKTLYDELAEIAIAFNFIDIRMDLCVPSTCTVADIQRVADLLSKKLEMRAKVMRCDVAARDGTTTFSKLDRISYYWMGPPLGLFALSLLATIILALARRANKSRCNGDQTNRNDQPRPETGRLMTMLECLSFADALRDRLATPAHSPTQSDVRLSDDFDSEAGSSDQASAGSCQQQVSPSFLKKPLPLYGLRNVFIFWFLVVQMTVELKYQYLRESLNLRNMIISYWPFQIIVNSVLLFDSLIVITAFTFSYSCLESSLRDLISYVVDKYLRLIVPIVTLIAMTIVTPLIGIESPVWRNFVDQQSQVCKSTGYIDLFFLQNFISYDKICLPHTWLFCVELQLIVLAIPIVLLLKKNFLSTEDAVIIGRGRLDQSKADCDSSLMRVAFFKLIQSKAGLLGLLLVLMGLCINFFSVYINQLPPSWFHTFPDVAQKNYYFGQYLTKTWTHLSVFVIGLLAGHLCRSTLQLRNIKLMTSCHSSERRQTQQPSPAPSGSTGHSHLASRHGSTSTIMASAHEIRPGDDQPDSAAAVRVKPESGSTVKRVSILFASIICMAAIIFSTFTWSTQEGPSVLVAASYDALSRLVWSLALVTIMTQLCSTHEQTNKYSTLARFFAHPICTLLGRLSFLAYLLSPYIHTFVLAVEEQSLFPSLFLIFHVIVGNIVITYTIAFLLAIVIEQPTRRLISCFILGDRLRKRKINISTYYDTRNPGVVPPLSLPKQVDGCTS